jgi:hypothetical protein
MTKLVLIFALILSPLASSQTTRWTKRNSADYTVNIHVAASRIGIDCDSASCKNAQILSVLIDGIKYELQSETYFPKGIVALGDYKAALIGDKAKPTREFTRTYDLMFPDKSTRTFRVIGQTE